MSCKIADRRNSLEGSGGFYIDDAPTADVIPASPQVEQRLLAAIIHPVLWERGEAVFIAFGALTPSDFFDLRHRHIFQAILDLREKQEPTDLVSIIAQLERIDKLTQSGGRDYLTQVVLVTDTDAHAKTDTKIILERSTQRRLITAADRLKSKCMNGPGDVSDLIEDHRVALSKIAVGAMAVDKNALTWGDLAQEVTTALETNRQERKTRGNVGICGTGFSSLDRRIGGLRPGQLIVIGGRTSMGKTALAVSLILNVCKTQSIPTAIFSLEMPQIDIGTRIVAGEADVSASAAFNGELEQQDMEAVSFAQDRLAGMPLITDKSAGMTDGKLIARCDELVRKHGVKVFILDYLQQVGSSDKGANREQQVAAVSRACKEIAMQHNVCFIALAQLNRDVEKQVGDKMPELHHLRESGSIEQDADVVLFPWRKIDRDADGHEVRGNNVTEAKVKIAKQRNGPLGIAPMVFCPWSMIFRDVSGSREPY